MNPTDKAEFAKVVLAFAELKGKQLSLPAVDLYWAAMQRWDIADFKAAANHLLMNCEFMPTPKDFEDLRKAGRDTAGEAWLIARQHLVWGLHGYTLSENCPPLIAKTLQMIGGADVVAMCDQDKLGFLERRFTEHYESLQESESTREAVPQIALHESVKRLAGGLKQIGKT